MFEKLASAVISRIMEKLAGIGSEDGKNPANQWLQMNDRKKQTGAIAANKAQISNPANRFNQLKSSGA